MWQPNGSLGGLPTFPTPDRASQGLYSLQEYRYTPSFRVVRSSHPALMELMVPPSLRALTVMCLLLCCLGTSSAGGLYRRVCWVAGAARGLER